METWELEDYIKAFRKRIVCFGFTTALLLILSLTISLSWSHYRSKATIEISQSSISSDATDPLNKTANASPEALADLRISYLQQKVLSTSSLIDIITQFNLYPSKREEEPIADVANAMQKKIKIDLVSSMLASPSSAQKASTEQLSAIAFTVGFTYSDPLLAQRVTNEIVSRFIDEDIKRQRTQAKETSAFLASQIKVMEESLLEQEKKIAGLRTENGAVRPEMLVFNQQTVVSLMANLQQIESEMTANLGEQGALRAQLAATDPYARLVGDQNILTTPSQQIKALKSRYALLSAQYGPRHPDVLKTQRQIQALESQMPPDATTNDTAMLKTLLEDTETRLAEARKIYGPDNPDILSLEKKRDGLQAQLQAAIARPTRASSFAKDADNPVYMQIVAQLEATQERYKSFAKQKMSLQLQLDKYQKAVIQNPAVEQQLAALSRDYENDQIRYRDLKARKMEADMAATIENDRMGRRLILLDAPDLPDDTHPPRLLLIFASVFLSFCGGVAAAIAKQILSQSLIGPRQVEAFVGAAPLVVVPYLRHPQKSCFFPCRWFAVKRPRQNIEPMDR